MNEPTLKLIAAELSDRLTGQKFGKIFALAKLRFAIDFRLRDGSYLFLGFEPNSPRLYLITRTIKELEKQSLPDSSFVSFARKQLANSVVEEIRKVEDERILKFYLAARSELGERQKYILVAQLTGHSSNLFLLDSDEMILETLRKSSVPGQNKGNRYSEPIRESKTPVTQWTSFPQNDFATLSEALDSHYQEVESGQNFEFIARKARTSLQREIKKRKRLRDNLEQDLNRHGDAEKWKHFGDLLLANISNAERNGNKIRVTDFFAENAPVIEVEGDENLSLTEIAERFFKRYTKARNAGKEIAKRRRALSNEIESFESKIVILDQAIAENNLEIVESFLDSPETRKTPKTTRNRKASFNGAKKFISTDGFEILVGKRSKDNDYLTFRVANSLDTWLHAADYPGSHVVIRNPNRKEIPRQTLVEAAGLAAFYSKARKEAKVAVNYTQKKFVNKPRKAAPGLVSLASFKTVLVRPEILAQEKKAG